MKDFFKTTFACMLGMVIAGLIIPIVGILIIVGIVASSSADSDIEITSDLKYLIDPYLSYEQMPKLVIYSKTNIKIDCDVKRIDALLIANDTVTTCANSNDINSSANANQLFVNGAIVAKKLVANRTYGAAAGANSIVPAEIINFDPTLYQFSSSAEMNDNAGGKLDTTYIHEVAPRI